MSKGSGSGGVPAYIVTVERNIGLARETQGLLERVGVRAELWLGADGAAGIEFKAGESVDHRRFKANYFRAPVPGEIGCYLSHYRLWQHALEQGHERMLVFEDDAVPLPSLEHVLPSLAGLGDEYEFIELATRSFELDMIPDYLWYLSRGVRLPHDHRLIRTVPIGGTYGYAVSNVGIRKLLPLLMPIGDPLDGKLEDLLYETDLSKYTVFPTLLRHGRTNIISGERAVSRGLLARLMRRKSERLQALPKRRRDYIGACVAEARKGGGSARPNEGGGILGSGMTQRREISGGVKRRLSKGSDAGGVPAYIVTVERNMALARETQELLGRVGVRAELWLGVDGAAGIEFKQGESVDMGTYRANELGTPPPTEIGCYLSHYRLWRHALEAGHERILVFEDDPLPLPALEDVLPEIVGLGGEYEYINLAPARHDLHDIPDYLQYLSSGLPLPRGHALLRSIVPGTGTYGYTVSASGMRKLLPGMMPIDWKLDLKLNDLVYAVGLRRYEVFPGLLAHTRRRSTIVGRGASFAFPGKGVAERFIWRTFRRRGWKRRHALKHARRRAAGAYMAERLAELRGGEGAE